jgi:hypothetical protein
MFDQCSNPIISNCKISANQIAGIIEKPDGNIALLSSDAVAYTVSLSGQILESVKLFNDVEILSFVEYGNEYWLTSSNNCIYVLESDLSIKNTYNLERAAVSVAPLEDRSGMIASYFDEATLKSSYEYRSLPDLKVLATGFYGPESPVVSSVAFFHENDIFLACCSKTELSLLKIENGEIVNLQHYRGRSEGRELNYSQLLSRSKRFLIDNMTGGVKPELAPGKYMERICFFRNDEATHGAIAKRNNWVAFLNPNVLKLVNYDTKKSYKFETKSCNPSGVKVFKYHVVCAYQSEISIYDFRSHSMRFILND